MGLDKPKYRFNLDINSLNLDRLLGTEDSGEESEEEATTGTAEQLLLPVAALQGLILEGQARIGEVITTGLVLSNVDATVNSDGNIVKLDPLNAEVAGGAVRVGLHYDVSGDVPAITLPIRLRTLTWVSCWKLLKLPKRLMAWVAWMSISRVVEWISME